MLKSASEERNFCSSFVEFFNQNVEAISDSKDSWNIEYHDSVQGADSTEAYLDGLQQVRANDRRCKAKRQRALQRQVLHFIQVMDLG